jgi:2',3'-cyclic-nucleotide 2'-phosphodiesterase (5'-nucleotidase family)
MRTPNLRGAAALLAAPLLALSLLSSAAVAKPGDTKSFTILHSNDHHGHLLPFSYPDRVPAGDDIAQLTARKDIGGIARRATLVKQIERQSKSPVYLFDAGDCMDGTPFSVEFFGRADYDAMNAAGYDYGVFGNHDFNMTPAQFDELKRQVKFKMLLANVANKADSKTPLPPYTVENWDGLRVAIFGLVTYDARTYKAAQQAYVVRDPVEVAKELVPRLRREADLVIAVTHDGVDVDRKMAREVPGIDVIVGGHSHTRLPVGVYEMADNPGPNDPKGTVIVQAHQWVGELGRLDLTLTEGTDGRWRLSRYSEQLIPVTKEIKEDPQVAKVVAGYWDKIKDKYGVVLGKAAGEFVETADNPSNYFFVADAMQEYAGSQFDLENRGGVRAPILAGPVTFADVVAVDPFENSVVTFKVKGRDLKAALVKTRPMPSRSLRYSLKKDGGQWSLVSATIDGKPVEDDAVYTGSANSYYFGYALKDVATDVKESPVLRRNVLVDAIKKRGTITPVEDGRASFGGADPWAN